MIFRIFFQVPYLLTPFVSHSSKNCRGVPTFFPFWFTPSIEGNRAPGNNSSPTALCAPCDLCAEKAPLPPLRPLPAADIRAFSSVNGTVHAQLPASATPLECAVPGFCAVTPLECAVPKTPSRKSFGMRSYEKRWGGHCYLQRTHFRKVEEQRNKSRSGRNACTKMRRPGRAA